MSVLELPWPPRALSPNSRGHWTKRHKASKAYRQSCYLLCRQARMQVPEGRLALLIEFVPPDRRTRDDDNLIASFKAGRDGLAEALGIDDARFTTRHSINETPTKGGAVRVKIEQL